MDDLIATGGTLGAAIQLVRNLNGEIWEASVIIDLPELNGNKMIKRKIWCVISMLFVSLRTLIFTKHFK